uniref:Uncharacterized protein n=1 Tax=Globisporangium ultimum (strain ATCC 200006 / CBS 805.95 / DAOM BR144) TaxID=431595 RepID=K3WWW2_GLOUD
MGKRRTSTHKLTASDENNSIAGTTLEDYFHSKNFMDAKKGGQTVSKHLLVGSPTNNAMVMEKEDAPEPSSRHDAKDDDLENQKIAGSDPEVKAESKAPDLGDNDHEAKPGHKVNVQDEENDDDGQSLQSNHDDYEDDYESETPSPDASVAGMTLSDYLHAKETGEPDAGVAAAKHQSSKKQEPPASKKNSVHQNGAGAHGGAKKDPSPGKLISGMSLDHYLGASSSDGHPDDDDALYNSADAKSPSSKPKKSKSHYKIATKFPSKVTNGTIGPARLSPTSSSQGEKFVTPFQKRHSKKQKAAKLKQQQSGHASISKSILLADPMASPSLQHGQSSSSSLSLQTKSISNPTPFKDRDKKKPLYQYAQQQQQQPPLPKLVASSSSAHSLSHKESEAHSHSDDEENEKLPPLAHH